MYWAWSKTTLCLITARWSGNHGPGSNRHSSLFFLFLPQPCATFLHHFYSFTIHIVKESGESSMSRDPGLINVLSLKQNNSLSDHRKVVRQSWTRIKSTLVTFFSFSSPTLRNILAPPLLLYNWYSAREQIEFDEPRSRSNQCIEPEAKQLFVWSPQGGQAIVDQDQIDTRHFFVLHNLVQPSCTTSIPSQFI